MGIFRRLLYAVGRGISSVFNAGIRIKYVLALLILFTGGAAALTYSKMLTNVGGKDAYGEAKRYIELKDVIQNKFIDPVDRDSMKDSASRAIVNGLGDKWSYYMNEDEYQSYQLYSANDYSDIGITMMKSESGGFEVISVTPGTPAGNSGLVAGDVITSVDEENVTNMDIDDVRVLIRSKVNTKFVIGCGKDKYTVDCSVNYVSPVSSRLEKTNAGYVKIKNFEAGSGQDAINAIEDLLAQKCEALCIDVRNNEGGLSGEVAILLDYLLPNGELFSKADKEGNRIITRSDAMSLQLPMVVLINEGTFAEAELFAQVLKDYSWATLLGEATSGMTRIQETFELDDGSAVHLSTQSYLTSNGTDIALAGGVIPDMIIHNSDPNTVGTTEGTVGESTGSASESADEQLMAGLKLLS